MSVRKNDETKGFFLSQMARQTAPMIIVYSTKVPDIYWIFYKLFWQSDGGLITQWSQGF